MEVVAIDVVLALTSLVCGITVIRWAKAAGPWKTTWFCWLIGFLILAVAIFGLYSAAEGREVPWPFRVFQGMFAGCFGLVGLTFYRAKGRWRRVALLLEQERYKEAAELVRSWMVRTKRPNPELHSLLGLVHFKSGDVDSAFHEFMQAYELSNRQPIYLTGLALAIHRMDRAEDALRLLDEALDRDPLNAAQYNFSRCVLLAKLGRTEEAIDLLADAERIVARGLSERDREAMEDALCEVRQLCRHTSSHPGGAETVHTSDS